MAQLFRLVADATTDTNTTLNPEIQQFFYKLDDTHRVEGVLTIPATSFIDDEDNPVAQNLPIVTENNGYYSLFINGVLQQTDLYTVAVDGSDVVINDTENVPVDAPIVLVVNNFDPDSDSTTTVGL